MSVNYNGKVVNSISLKRRHNFIKFMPTILIFRVQFSRDNYISPFKVAKRRVINSNSFLSPLVTPPNEFEELHLLRSGQTVNQWFVVFIMLTLVSYRFTFIYLTSPLRQDVTRFFFMWGAHRHTGQRQKLPSHFDQCQTGVDITPTLQCNVGGAAAMSESSVPRAFSHLK